MAADKNIRRLDDVLRDADGNTMLHKLCRDGITSDALRQALAWENIPLDILNHQGQTPLALAIQHAPSETVAALIDMGASLYVPLEDGRAFNAVLCAVYSSRPSCLQAVLERGGGRFVNLRGMAADGTMSPDLPMHAAIDKINLTMVEELILQGAFMNAVAGKDALPPLSILCRANAQAIAQTLVEFGADVDQEDAQGDTALHHAVRVRNLRMVKFLIAHGADVNKMASFGTGMTPLMIAASQGRVEIVQELLRAKADTNIQSPAFDNQTALMMAARRCDSEIAVEILAAGSDPLLTDIFNKTAAQHVDVTRNRELKNFMAEEENAASRKIFEKSYSKYKP